MSQAFLVEKEGGVVTITINRPERLNALTHAIAEEMRGVLAEARGDDTKVVIITGAGRGFCSGADLAAGAQPEPEREERVVPFGGFGRLIQELWAFPKPTIAAVNGPAAGMGLSLAAAADIRIASEAARFSSIFVRRGLVADCGATYLLPRLLGLSRALELMWTGDMLDAATAERLGLVNRVVPADRLLPEARALAERLARGPSLAIELMKRLAYQGLTGDLASSLSAEAWAQSLCGQSEDAKEGRTSFLEKREPLFKGR